MGRNDPFVAVLSHVNEKVDVAHVPLQVLVLDEPLYLLDKAI